MLLAIVILLGASCTVQKRVHRKGWYVEWHGANHAKNKSADESHSIQDASKTKINSAATQNEIHSGTANKSVAAIKSQNPTNETVRLTVSESETQSTDLKSDMSGSQSEPIKETSSKKSIVGKYYTGVNTLRPPTRVPTLAWALLILGLSLLAIGVIAALIFAIINLTFIGLPFGYTLAIISGIIILILATGVALSSMRSQPSPPDPRYVEQEPKREKKERKPLAKNDKIFLAIIGGLVAGILISILTF